LKSNKSQFDRVVITGIGLLASVGQSRESVWQAVRHGRSGVRRLTGVQGVPDGLLLGATISGRTDRLGRLKPIPLCQTAAAEAIDDAQINLAAVNRDRFGVAVSAHMGDTDYVKEHIGRSDLIDAYKPPWWHQWFPNTACSTVANSLGLNGPRLCHSTACASGMIDLLCAVRSIQDHQCDMALAGSAEAIHPLFAAGFQKMRVLADHDDPTQACRPFDANRRGFVMGEGAAMFVLERLAHARARGAQIYAEVLGGATLADAHHVTSLEADSTSLAHLITITLQRAGLAPHDVDYINAHGTGTLQNDAAETRAIRRALGPAANSVSVSSTKSMLGHLVNASGSVELAITTLALRDGFFPPTINLTEPDPECDLDCIPLVGRREKFEHALKLSVAFGGHLAAVALRRWTGPEARSELQEVSRMAA